MYILRLRYWVIRVIRVIRIIRVIRVITVIRLSLLLLFLFFLDEYGVMVKVLSPLIVFYDQVRFPLVVDFCCRRFGVEIFQARDDNCHAESALNRAPSEGLL